MFRGSESDTIALNELMRDESLPAEIKIMRMKRMLHAPAGLNYQTFSSIQEAEAFCHKTIHTYILVR